MLNAVIAGDIHFTGVNVFSALPFIKAGKLRALAQRPFPSMMMAMCTRYLLRTGGGSANAHFP